MSSRDSIGWRVSFFVLIEDAYVLLLRVEMKSCDRLSIVVIEKYREVGFGIAVNDPLRLGLGDSDRLNYLIGLEFLKRGFNVGIGFDILDRRSFAGVARSCFSSRWRLDASAKGCLQSIIHLVGEELLHCLLSQRSELIASASRDNSSASRRVLSSAADQRLLRPDDIY